MHGQHPYFVRKSDLGRVGVSGRAPGAWKGPAPSVATDAGRAVAGPVQGPCVDHADQTTQRASSEEPARCRDETVPKLSPEAADESGAQRQLFAGRTPVGNEF